MDGVHDLGGKQGFGPVRYATSKYVFKAAWEPRANALYSLAVRLGLFNMDEYRHAIEWMEPRRFRELPGKGAVTEAAGISRSPSCLSCAGRDT